MNARRIPIHRLFTCLCDMDSCFNGLIDEYERIKSNIQLIECISQITLDSRQSQEHYIFVAVQGQKNHGKVFIENALKNGTRLVLVEVSEQNQQEWSFKNIVDESLSNPKYLEISVYDLSNRLSQCVSWFYDLSDHGEIIAVTGTNGKTTVANLCAQLISLINQSSTSIGTLGVLDYDQGKPTKRMATLNTTPDICFLSSVIQYSFDTLKASVVLEASSHGLEQQRLGGLSVSTGIFTNLSQDHLDYHVNMEAYASAKRRLLMQPCMKNIVLNADDPESQNWSQNALKRQDIYWYSVKQKLGSDKIGCWASDIHHDANGTQATIHSFKGSSRVSIPLIGLFNLSNVLACVTALLANGYHFSEIISNLPFVTGVPGRMEIFNQQTNKAFASIVVDYAHTPDALKQALLAAKKHTTGQLICIFGCGGNRDVSKRSIMGKLADQYADKIVLTEDNSRTEPIETIVKNILEGIADKNKVAISYDRKKAIQDTWLKSEANDLILLAGKGHEDYIEKNNKRYEYDERHYVQGLVNEVHMKLEECVSDKNGDL